MLAKGRGWRVECFRKKNDKCKAVRWKACARNWEIMREELQRKMESR